MNARKRQTLIVLAILAVLLWVRFGHHSEPKPYPKAVPATAVPSPTASPMLTVNQDAASARAAITAWQAPTSEARQAQLAPIASTDYLAAAATIDPANVPSSPIASVDTHEAPDGSAVVDVTLQDGTAVVVDLTADGLVTDIGPR